MAPDPTGEVRSAWYLAGPTAVGKTELAHVLAQRMGCPVVSADSMLVYRGMNIGTAKPPSEKLREVSYIGIDLVAPSESFHVQAYLSHLRSSLPKGDPPIVCGGTGLYLSALARGFDDDSNTPDPDERARWEKLHADQGVEGLKEVLRSRNPKALAALPDPENPRRLIRAIEQAERPATGPRSWRSPTKPVLTGLTMPRPLLLRTIEERARTMYNQGLLEELEELLRTYGTLSKTAMQAIGYAEAAAVLNGRLSREEALERTCIRTRQLAKKQRTWFTHQFDMRWLEWDGKESIDTLAGRMQDAWKKYGIGLLHI